MLKIGDKVVPKLDAWRKYKDRSNVDLSNPPIMKLETIDKNTVPGKVYYFCECNLGSFCFYASELLKAP